MSMVTQCPHCTTAFNVTPDQLFARDGRVRCNACKKIFDGLVNLTSLEALRAGTTPPLVDAEAAKLAAANAPAPPAPPSHGFSPRHWPMLPDVPQVPLPPTPLEIAAVAAMQTDAPQPLAAASAQATAVPLTPRSAPRASRYTADAAPAAPVDEPAEHLDVTAPAPRRARGVWAIAAMLALVALCGQALYVFRNEIAAQQPGVKPTLVQLCEFAQCTIRPLQRPGALAITASDLLIVNQARPQMVQLIVTMQNQSAVAVGYPAVDLTLNDRFNHVVARRVFLPAEYLQGAEAQKKIIAASVTTTVRVDLDLSELSAGGFEVLLVPAPNT